MQGAGLDVVPSKSIVNTSTVASARIQSVKR